MHSIYCLPGVLEANTLLTSPGKSVVSNVQGEEVAGFCWKILAVFSDVLLSSGQMPACLKQVCLFSDQHILEGMGLHNFLCRGTFRWVHVK